MSYFEIFIIILILIILSSSCIFLFKKLFRSKSNLTRIEKDLKIYYDKDFKECVDILSKRLLKDEFEKVCTVLCNLRNGYDYGFNDSIDYAFYKEINKIRNQNNKQKIQKIVSLK